MEKMRAITVMSALAQPTRLAVFSLLARADEEGMTAGELAERTGTPANTMSAHLAILTQAGLATSRKAGRNKFYRALPTAVRQLATFLITDCCNGTADKRP
jgi:ArsR family transcriptional regulator